MVLTLNNYVIMSSKKYTLKHQNSISKYKIQLMKYKVIIIKKYRYNFFSDKNEEVICFNTSDICFLHFSFLTSYIEINT